MWRMKEEKRKKERFSLCLFMLLKCKTSSWWLKRMLKFMTAENYYELIWMLLMLCWGFQKWRQSMFRRKRDNALKPERVLLTAQGQQIISRLTSFVKCASRSFFRSRSLSLARQRQQKIRKGFEVKGTFLRLPPSSKRTSFPVNKHALITKQKFECFKNTLPKSCSLAENVCTRVWECSSCLKQISGKEGGKMWAW